jgi:DNA modification methylase
VLTGNGKNPGDVADFWAIDPGEKYRQLILRFIVQNLIKKPIIAGSPEGGIILDPFGGTGTTAFSSINHGRKFIYIDGSQEYYQNFCKEMDRFDAQLKIQFPEAI